jgi:hypothetical protein
VEIIRDSRHAEDEDEEIEGIERPAKKTCRKRMPLLRAQAPERTRHNEEETTRGLFTRLAELIFSAGMGRGA